MENDGRAGARGVGFLRNLMFFANAFIAVSLYIRGAFWKILAKTVLADGGETQISRICTKSLDHKERKEHKRWKDRGGSSHGSARITAARQLQMADGKWSKGVAGEKRETREKG